jgi:hypothetical protein
MPCLTLPFHSASVVPVIASVNVTTTRPQCVLPSRRLIARTTAALWVCRPTRDVAALVASLVLPLAPGISRRALKRGILGPLPLVNFAVLATALQGHFFFVDDHGVRVGLLAAAGALVTIC